MCDHDFDCYNDSCDCYDDYCDDCYENECDCYEMAYDDRWDGGRGYAPHHGGRGPSASGEGCYVATAIYGSYDCPQVWILRRFRDYTLAETWYGRAFIRTYYAISPALVKWFGHTNWFKNSMKRKLDKLVSDLRDNGVEDSPYEDRNWR